MNLVIDIGNTRIKLGLYKNNQLMEFVVLNSMPEVLQSDFITKSSHIIIGTVVNNIEAFVNQLSQLKPVTIFTSQTPIPIQNLYQSVSTLGSDRIAASIGAYYLYPNSNVLVIDAGTCIKYNFINAKNQYLGGGISPGIEMRFNALNKFTSKLPYISMEENFNTLIGNTTKNSILSGVLNGTVAEINGIINQYKSNYTDLICVLTGGNSQYLANHLKSSIFTHQNLVLKGLNDILNFTIETNTL